MVYRGFVVAERKKYTGESSGVKCRPRGTRCSGGEMNSNGTDRKVAQHTDLAR